MLKGLLINWLDIAFNFNHPLISPPEMVRVEQFCVVYKVCGRQIYCNGPSGLWEPSAAGEGYILIAKRLKPEAEPLSPQSISTAGGYAPELSTISRLRPSNRSAEFSIALSLLFNRTAGIVYSLMPSVALHILPCGQGF